MSLESKECPLCLVDAQSAESGSKSKSTLREIEQLSSLLELGALLVSELRETNQLLREMSSHTTLLIDAMAHQNDEEELIDESRYLDGTQRN